MPFSALRKSIPTIPLVLLLICIPIMNWGLGDGSFVLIEVGLETVPIAHIEILTNLTAIAVMALIVPTMPSVDIWRTRAKKLALARYVCALFIVLIIATSAAIIFQVIFLKGATGAIYVEVPESGLIVNNSTLIAAVTAIIIPFIGRLRGIPFVILLWVAGMTPLYVDHTIHLWPLDYFKQPGPWFSWPHIITTSLAVVVAGVIQYRTAYLSRSAVDFERVHG